MPLRVSRSRSLGSFWFVNRPGVGAALASAILFGAGTPIAKVLLNEMDSWLLAGLLYFGSGIGLTIYRQFVVSPSVRLPHNEAAWFAAAILAGGVVGPVLLMVGLSRMPASTASLLLNAEGVFTALLAWYAFHENFDRRIAVGMAAIVAGALVLSWPRSILDTSSWPAIAILSACLAWALDNNLTRKVSLSDATWVASIKGLAAGSVNLTLAMLLGAAFPTIAQTIAALVLGFVSYGVSLTLFVIGLRSLGTARTGAYFSIAPFFGAMLAILFGETMTVSVLVAGLLMGVGVWLHVTEQHTHEHSHELLEHEHEHVHDDLHHDHEHDFPVAPGTKHSHPHRHEAQIHTHAHFPDAHHRHGHP